MSRCEENKKISSKVWDFMDYVRDVGEESITDYLVWQWRKLNSRFNFLDVDKHTRFNENTVSGADFELELWLLTRSQSIAFVFQAKKLVGEYNSYRSKLNYQNGPVRQIDRLSDYAISKNRLPFYIFYSQSNPNTTTLCPLNAIERTALFMTDANTVDQIIIDSANHRLSKNEILSKTNPFHCLFCCPIGEEDLHRYVTRYFPRISQDGNSFDSNSIPAYVNLIASNDLANIDGLISEYKLNVFRKIGVLDLRKECD